MTVKLASGSSVIENVIFDVGNVIVQWSPMNIVKRTFGDALDAVEVEDKAKSIFDTPIWRDLNKGHFTEAEAKEKFATLLDLDEQTLSELFHHIKDSQTLVSGTVNMMRALKAAGYGIYGLTDNVREIVSYLQSRYDFWALFEGVTVSAEVGHLKPQPEIYQHVLAENQLVAEKCIFLDDMPHNVAGAESAGIQALLFKCAESCALALREKGLSW